MPPALVKKRRIPADSSDGEEDKRREDAARLSVVDSSDEELFTEKDPSTPHSMKLHHHLEQLRLMRPPPKANFQERKEGSVLRGERLLP